MSFGENLRRLRRDKGWSQMELATKAGIKTSHISTMETSNDGDPKLSTIYKLINALGCSPNTLLQDETAVGVQGIMEATLERASNLDEESKRVVVEIVDHYCIAKGLQQMLRKDKNGIFPNILWSTSDIEPALKRKAED